ncbi:MAG: hypothetical protein AAGI24_17630 [Pseudomonadota bacterium]
MHNSFFQRVLLPGFLFQSVIIGGGYATGRELVEFFLSMGPIAGLLGMVVATAAFSLVMAVAFELARLTMSYTYRHFFQQLLGKGWLLYELGYFVMGLLVLAVIGSAAGEIVAQQFGIPALAGTLGLMLLIGYLVFYPTAMIERVLALWSFVLYATYVLLVVMFLQRFGDAIPRALSAASDGPWLLNGIKYVGYNVSAVPVILFCVMHMQSRRDALLAGALGGPIAMVPALLLLLPMIASYPGILSAPVPADYLMQQLDSGLFQAFFYIVIFGTFVETGAAYIHAVNERIAEAAAERSLVLPRWYRPVLALFALVLSIALAHFVGFVQLISDGYGTLTWFFVLVFIVPLLTRGVWLVAQRPALVTNVTSD